MRYLNLTKAIFRERPNRFTAKVEMNGKEETAHIKNTGRLRELLVPGTEVLLQHAENPNRKTQYDLIMVWSQQYQWVNIDSTAPNVIVHRWFIDKSANSVKPEYPYGDSRLDFYVKYKERRIMAEVKGCTLAENGIGLFPDAPTERGSRHLEELIKAKKEGYEAFLIFVVMLDGVYCVRANEQTDQQFSFMMRQAAEQDVNVICLTCRSDEKGTYITKETGVPVWMI